MRAVVWLILVVTELVFAAEIPKNFEEYLRDNPEESVKVWVFFKDKPDSHVRQMQKATSLISQKALDRRILRGQEKGLQQTDFPVDENYIKLVSNYAERVGHASRWLNALAVWSTPKDIGALLKLSFIREIRPVARRITGPEKISSTPPYEINGLLKTTGLNYGPSQFQLTQIGVPPLHDKGLSGKGVTIAMLDDGFNLYKKHIAFDSLNVLAVHDFVNNDSTVDDPNAPANKGTHGTRTLSVIAGYAPGHLIGPAYGASFLLAKTEIDSVEIPLEEDNWVAGLEWAEAKGADIVSSSLGYIDWYTQQDMDGRTALTTLATVIAEQKGLIVVNSAGNEGLTRDDALNTLIAPADGEFVITAGGVTTNSLYWSVASRGPTVDGRIKPDVSALANNVLVASPFNTQGYLYNSGTSFSCPLIAGSIALLLQAYPELNPQQVRNLIHHTASISDAPDNEIGYGILNIAAAYDLADSTQGQFGKVSADFTSQTYPNPFSDYTRLPYGVEQLSSVKLRVFNSLGQVVYSPPPRIGKGEGYFILTARDLNAAGVYYFSLEIKVSDGARQLKKGKLLFLR